jgi:membrane-associated protease RseP (regulator of RpoE activity)
VEVSRQGKIVELTVTPRSNGVKATIGLGIANNMKEVVRVKAVNVFDAMLMGAEETGRIVRLNVQAVQRFFSSDFNVEAVGGPISVIKAGAEV